MRRSGMLAYASFLGLLPSPLQISLLGFEASKAFAHPVGASSTIRDTTRRISQHADTFESTHDFPMGFSKPMEKFVIEFIAQLVPSSPHDLILLLTSERHVTLRSKLLTDDNEPGAAVPSEVLPSSLLVGSAAVLTQAPDQDTTKPLQIQSTRATSQLSMPRASAHSDFSGQPGSVDDLVTVGRTSLRFARLKRALDSHIPDNTRQLDDHKSNQKGRDLLPENSMEDNKAFYLTELTPPSQSEESLIVQWARKMRIGQFED
ncbi:hypothetical protein MJO28_007966 [Puccinia striiformis f. sp. tritici]|uniref:Uncharacterized protein n=4 Tax=Puccinia striiformis TaxID=27350 RepID=A0A0L0UYF8_9BASI|nr:hypothetical protein MJO28_007966 [Puccinia striiformis f. sp. tritici]KAI7952268.1 hypothetical protein MJO29_007899 [Puccinia striiformis f. sp. tritici]KNE91794.1 hypothetical protein PSTG_14811 [Puccinia striiformis f. sp. tritici PST-78]POW04322.1 hypothetical protein PSHT_11227 [Puccinia striiformis]POW06585.1 hypothetical protein PSTT_08865 [Puccinia striiformis]